MAEMTDRVSAAAPTGERAATATSQAPRVDDDACCGGDCCGPARDTLSEGSAWLGGVRDAIQVTEARLTHPKLPGVSDAFLPVAVIGAGPVGLAAAAHLLERGAVPLVLEAGSQVGASVAAWRHVRLFSPWSVNVDAAAVRLLRAGGWTAPASEELPTGAELLDRYLRPLAALPDMAAHVRLGHRVVGIARRGMDKVRSAGREVEPFLLRVRGRDGQEDELLARAVIDASGTWTHPNPLGATGLPARGEPQAAAAGKVLGGLPDILGAERDRFAGRRVLVVGAGHSAATSLLALAELRHRDPSTQVVWAVRRAVPSPLVRRGERDELPARGRLIADVAALVEAGVIEVATGFHTTVIDQRDDGLEVVGASPDGEQRLKADLVVNATGFRPDLSLTRELRLHLDPTLESAGALAPLIDPNVHSCGTVPRHGWQELAHPEPGYFAVGMKSYGRAPTFLLATGYEQVRSVVAYLTGDYRVADRIQRLPSPGACGVADAPASEAICVG
jgi:thioredoxin reductase